MPDPFASYLLIRGIKTLALRVARQKYTAVRLAAFLAAHPKIERVHHPSLPTHPEHDIAKRQMAGFGAVVSFEKHMGHRIRAAIALLDTAVKVEVDDLNRRVEAPGRPPMRSEDGGRTWESAKGTL